MHSNYSNFDIYGNDDYDYDKLEYYEEQKNKNFSNNNNYNNFSVNNNSSKQLTLEDALSKSSYPKYTEDFVKEFLIKNYSNNKNAKVYLIPVDEEKIFGIEYNLPITFQDKIYNVYILIYLPPLFPYYEPEFYISKKRNIGLIEYYHKGKINPVNLKININSFVPYDATKNNIEEIIDKIKEEFNNEFPIYKINNYDKDDKKFSGKCFLNINISNEIIFKNKNNNNNLIEDDIDDIEDIDDIYGDSYSRKKDIYNNNKDFDDASFLEFIKNQVKDILREKYMNFNEKFNIKKYLNELKEINNNTQENLEEIKLNSDVISMRKEMEKLKNIKNKLNLMENRLIQENFTIKENNDKSILDKCNDLIEIKNDKILEYNVMLKALEDYLVYLKKAYEKKRVSFNDMVDQTRLLSREIFNIEYLCKKEKRKKLKKKK